MVTVIDDDVDKEQRITTHEEIEHMLAEESDDEMSVTPMGNYSQHFILYDLERVRPAYKINFHLDEDGIKNNAKSALKNGHPPQTKFGQQHLMQPIKDKCQK